MKVWLFIFLVGTMVLDASAGQFTNVVEITTNIDFFVRLRNTSRPGLEFKSDDPIDYVFAALSTNVSYIRKFPYGNFDFHLFNAAGAEVPKTPAGLKLTRTPPKPTRDALLLWNQSRFLPFFVGAGAVNTGPLFRPDDVFMMTNPGVYQLEVRTRLCVIMTNGAPDLSAMINALNWSSRGAPLFKRFGVLTSPPLRVNVIKE